MTELLLAAAFSCSAVFELLVVEWHGARERGALATGTAIAMLLEALHWAPAVIAIGSDDPRYLIAAVLGAGAGAHVGLRRYRARKERAKLPLARIVPD